MATSGSSDFSVTRLDICKAAARKVGAIVAGESMDADAAQDFSDALNAMVKHWQATGTYIWTNTEGILFLQADQNQYSLGAASTDHATETWYETTLSAAEAAAQTVLSITSTANITAADYIGIELDSGSWHFTTVSSKDSTTATVASALPSAAASGNRVISYTTKLVRPLAILSARRYNFDSDIDIPLTLLDRVDYQEQPNKLSEGPPNSLFYDRRGGTNTLGRLHVWPTPGDIVDAIKFTFARPIQDFDAATNDADLPQEWIRALIWNLAVEMAPEYELPEAKIQRLERQAERYLAEVQWWEGEGTGVQFMPDMR